MLFHIPAAIRKRHFSFEFCLSIIIKDLNKQNINTLPLYEK